MNPTDAKRLLKLRKAMLIRWDEAFDSDENNEWWHVLKDEPEDLALLSSKTRNLVRRGLKDFESKPCSQNFIEEHGKFP